MIIEEAKEKNQELWLILQDIKKAFDSVSLRSLELAIQKIKVLRIGKKFIMALFNK